MPSWRNWQTRTFQGRVDVSPSGFKSLARHKHSGFQTPEQSALGLIFLFGAKFF